MATDYYIELQVNRRISMQFKFKLIYFEDDFIDDIQVGKQQRLLQ